MNFYLASRTNCSPSFLLTYPIIKVYFTYQKKGVISYIGDSFTMAGKKINCPKCRRSYDNKIEYCPYCGSQNPLFSDAASFNENASLVNTQNNITKNDASEQSEVYDDQNYYDDSGEYSEDYQEEAFDEYYNNSDSDSSSDSESDSDTSELSTSAGREKIDWTDEEKEKNVEHDNMYDENGEYNPNYDHYYDDTKAKIDNELERLSAGKEKAILKIIGGIAAVIGVIVYLILTL